jgi:RHS repeat-associated protein
LRNPANQTAYTPGSEPELLLNRGYTGHEHLPAFGLVNMNARLYDPATGRFLSPDPYVQAPDFSQNFNRYSYVLNNPLIYSDPSGEKWWHWLGIGLGLLDPVSAITTGLAISGTISASALTTMPVAAGTAATIAGTTYATTIANTPLLFFGGAIDKDWARGRQLVSQSWKINNGLFYPDSNQDFLDQMQQLTSRLTWEGLQTIAGYNYTQIRNGIGNVDRVDFLGGATFTTKENSSKYNGLTLGNYINMNINGTITGDFENYVLGDPMYMHEYGHVIDGRGWGPLYLFAIGIPSLISAAGDGDHSRYWTEIRANRRARSYFGRYYGINWNFSGYPLN